MDHDIVKVCRKQGKNHGRLENQGEKGARKDKIGLEKFGVVDSSVFRRAEEG